MGEDEGAGRKHGGGGPGAQQPLGENRSGERCADNDGKAPVAAKQQRHEKAAHGRDRGR